MKELCGQLLEVLRDGRSLNRFGEILHDAWRHKRGLVEGITNEKINEYYDAALKAGALGGKLLGAGGGGFLLFYVEPQNHDRVRRALGELPELPFLFEPQGSKVIYVSDDV
jgi:D-glycero-alpha-D-manno-heptose-7-phosphate kinase